MIAVEEFKEDVQVGDCVRVDTPKGSFSGKVTKIRTTTMKLEVAGREQTIAIDTLEGYEVLDGDAAREAAEAPAAAPEEPQKAPAAVRADRFAAYFRQAEEARFVSGTRSAWEQRKASLPAQSHDVENRVWQKFDNAVRMHEDTMKGKMHDIIAICKRKTLVEPDNFSAQFQLGLLYNHVGEAAKAAKAYSAAGAYEAACASCAHVGRSVPAEYAVPAARQGSLAALWSLRSEGELFWATCRDVLCHFDEIPAGMQEAFAGAIAAALARQTHTDPDVPEALASPEGVAALVRAVEPLAGDGSRVSALQQELEKQQHPQEKKPEKGVRKDAHPERPYYEGTVINFNTERGFGFLRNPEGRQTYFHIYQVNDKTLRRWLRSGIINVAVRYCLGINIMDAEKRVAGDDVHLSEIVPVADVVASMQLRTGEILQYDPRLHGGLEGGGKIRLSNLTTYAFRDKQIVDPKLLEYLKGYFHSGVKWPVRFLMNQRGGKGTPMDIESARPFPEDVQSDWQISRTFEKPEQQERIQTFLLYKSMKSKRPAHAEDILTYNFDTYAPLPQAADAAGAHAAEEPSASAEAPQEEVFNISWLTRDVGTWDYNHAHDALLDKRFEEAERFYRIALKKGECVESAIGDLLFLYLRLGKMDDAQSETYYDTAFQLMKEARVGLPPEKYTKHMITLLSSTKREPERLVTYLAESAGDGRQPIRTRFDALMRKAALEFQLEKFADLLASCRLWKQMQRTSYLKPSDAMGRAIDRYECFALYMTGSVEEALEKARQIQPFFPSDEALRQLLHRTWNPDATPEKDYDVSNDFENIEWEMPGFIKDYLYNVSLTEVQETSDVKDGVGIVRTDVKGEGLDQGYQKIWYRGKRQAATPKEKAKWRFLIAKYILLCLQSWPKLHLSEPLESVKINEEELKRLVLSGLQYMIEDESDARPDEQRMDTVRFYYLLRIGILHAMEPGRGKEKEIEQELCKYVCTYFYPLSEVVGMSKNKNIFHMSIDLLGRQPTTPISRMRIGLSRLVREIAPYATEQAGQIQSLITKFEDEGNAEAQAEERFQQELAAQAELEESFPQEVAHVTEDFSSIDAITRLEAYLAKEKPHLTGQDERNCGTLLDSVIPYLKQFWESEDFSTRLDSLNIIRSKAADLQKTIWEAPTAVSYELLRPFLTPLQDYADAQERDLYRSYAPSVTVSLAECNKRADGSVSITLALRNKSGCQPADSATLAVFRGEQEIEAAHDSGFVLRDERTKRFTIPKRELIDAETGKEMKTIDLKARVRYSCKEVAEDGSLNLAERQVEKPLSVSLDRQQFQEIPNPYSPYTRGAAVKNPKMVFGRTELIESMIGMIRDGNDDLVGGRCIVIYGQKRSGKTTILYQLNKAVGQHFDGHAGLPICIDLGSMGDIVDDPAHPGQFLANFLAKMASKMNLVVRRRTYKEFSERMREEGIECPSESLPLSKNPTGKFYTYLDDYLRVLKAWNPHANLIFFLDEFTYLYPYIVEKKSVDVSFLKFWKAFMQTSDCLAIIVGQNYMGQLLGLLPNEFGAYPQIQISYLSEQAVKDMITKPLDEASGHRVEVNDAAVHAMYRASAGNPYFQMILCSWLVDHLNRQSITHVTEGVVKEMIEERIDREDQEFLSEEELFQPLVADVGNMREEMNKNVLISLVENDRNAHGITKDQFANEPELQQDKEELLMNLRRRGILDFEDGRYRIRAGLVHHWIVKKYGGK